MGNENEEEPKSDGLLRLFAAEGSQDGDENQLSVEDGETGLAAGELSLESGTESDEESAAETEGEDEESEPGNRAQKRIEALAGAKNKLEREVVPELQSKLLEANKVIGDLRGEMAAIEEKPPEWFEALYGNFEDPIGTARFDAALCGVLDEPAFREDPSVKKVIDRVMAELKKRGFKMAQDAKSQVEKKPAAETQPVSEDWTARSIVESSVKDVLKRAGVRPELIPVLTEGVTPELLKSSTAAKALPPEKAIVDAISARVKALGWKPDFYRAPKEDAKQEARPGTGGARAAVVTPKKATAKADAKGDAKPEAPKTAEEADALRANKIRTLIEQLPPEQRGAVA